MIKKLKQSNRGFTLMEIIVSLALFTAIVLSAAQIFKMVIESQRNAIIAQNMQGGTRYAFDTMSKEIRMAQKDEIGTCTGEGNVNRVYAVSEDGQELYFKNYHGECVAYYLDNANETLMIERHGYVAKTLPDQIKVKALQFSIIDDVDNVQSLVIANLEVEAEGKETEKQDMIIQTAVSSRYYE
ncbi:hypothetical protein COV49_04480 [Candidatus Falkowbacteria bacterium CG11_big_fil_rev_8_21_14_0_20_39_10]|uniref:Prepilin-type N-terminal cleavage/methylation domain-containing protein n=1 Tax=Candidatus Falkowbacteria bacterium CG11_big_fil_rev_8_21_14_0_20_39_10 TaxID=1974570 RepID=A0A2M6K822_9BACT|nr:MAG: hypothetical protein COV49_04480 [Candidatus Falkowbacteria bacterium CG11_big_fil_rev_8_21_14_0_20_39_10]